MRLARVGIIAVFVLVAAAAALAGGLARDDGPAPVAPSEAPDLTATAEIRRSFAGPDTVAIAVTNGGDAPVRVLGLELVGDAFEPVGIQDFDAEIPPGGTRDLIADHGAARCPDGVDTAAAPTSAVLDVRTEDGAAHRVTADLPHPNPTLDRLVREACAAEFIAETVEISLGELTEAADGTLTGVLTVAARTDESVVVTEVRGSVLFVITAEDLSGDSVPLSFDAHRCEGHVVGDAKQPFAFNAWIAVGGAEPLAAPVPVDEAAQQRLYAMLDVRCGHSHD